MKIALLSHEYPAETGFGGIGTYTWYHARALARLGHEVHVLAGATTTGPMRTEGHDGVVVHRLRTAGWLKRALEPLGKARIWWGRNRLETALDMYRGLRQLQHTHRFDVIEMPECGGEGMLVNQLMHGPTVVRFHSPARLIMPFYDVRRADMRLTGFAEQLGISGARGLSSCSAFLAEEVRTRLGVRRPISVIPNGIDLALFDATDPGDFRARHGIPAGRPMIFFAGRMERRKGIHLVREIVGTLVQRHDVSVVMAGQDLFHVMRDEILPAVAAMPGRGSLHYLGKLGLDDVRAGVRASDVFLLPSLWENCPYSCLEAMAAGRAIVSTDQGGMPELIAHGRNGLLARNGNAASYLEQLEILLGDDGRRRRLGEAARAEVEARLTDVHVAEASVQLYRTLGGHDAS